MQCTLSFVYGQVCLRDEQLARLPLHARDNDMFAWIVWLSFYAATCTAGASRYDLYDSSLLIAIGLQWVLDFMTPVHHEHI